MEGIVSIPAILISINGLPSVDAIAIPPWFAVISVEASSLRAFVVNPNTISLSLTINSLTVINAVVPPTVIFPLTFRSELILVLPVTVSTENVGVSLRVIVAPTPDAVAVRFPLTKLTELTPFGVPTGLFSSRIVIPVIAPADAAGTQLGAASTPFELRT